MQDIAVNSVKMMLKTKNRNIRRRGRNVIMPETLNKLFLEYQKQVINTEATPVNRYSFDF